MVRIRPPFQQCPARGSALGHIQNGREKPDGRCIYCECPYDFVAKKWGVPESDQDIAPELRRDYERARSEGLGDQDAQALVAHLHGLGPSDGQKKPWTLDELNDLMILKRRNQQLG